MCKNDEMNHNKNKFFCCHRTDPAAWIPVNIYFDNTLLTRVWRYDHGKDGIWSTASCIGLTAINIQFDQSDYTNSNGVFILITFPNFHLPFNYIAFQWGRFINKKRGEKNKNRGERQKNSENQVTLDSIFRASKKHYLSNFVLYML
jgi:hypothetical protein